MEASYGKRPGCETSRFLKYSMTVMFVFGIVALLAGFFLEYQHGVADPLGAEFMRRLLAFFGYNSFPVAAKMSFFLAAICQLYCILMGRAQNHQRKAPQKGRNPAG